MPKISKHLSIGDVSLRYVEYGINEKFKPDSEEITLDIKPEFNISIKRNKKQKNAILSLELKLFKKNSPEYPIWFKIKNQAYFEWEDETKDIDKFLKTVGAAHLLSYMRPFVSQLTTMSSFPALTLPLIDFTEDEESK